MHRRMRYIALAVQRGSGHMAQKTATLNLRVTPELKELLRLAADREHRTVANFIETLVYEHCARLGLRQVEVKHQPKN